MAPQAPHKKHVNNDKIHKHRGIIKIDWPLQRGDGVMEQHKPGESFHPNEILRNHLQKLGLQPTYTTPRADRNGLTFHGYLTILPDNVVFEHRRPEATKSLANTCVSLKALKWLENREKVVEALADHTDSQPSVDMIVSLVRTFKLSSSSDQPLYQHALNPKLAEEDPHMKLMFDEAVQEYRSSLVSNEEYASTLPSQIALVLEGRFVDEDGNINDKYIRDTLDTVGFAVISEPLSWIDLIDVDHAYLVGNHLGRPMLLRFRPEVSMDIERSVYRAIEDGMRAVSDRPSRKMLSATEAPMKSRAEARSKDDSTADNLSYDELRALTLIAKRMVDICPQIGNHEEFYRDLGVRLMLQLEIYPRKMALAVLEGFHDIWVGWLRHKERLQQTADATATPQEVEDQDEKNENSDTSMHSVRSEEARGGSEESQHEQSSPGIDGDGDSKMNSALLEEVSPGKMPIEEDDHDDGLNDTTMRSNSTLESSSEDSTVKYMTPQRSTTQASPEPTTEDSTSEDSTEKFSESISSFDESDLDASTPPRVSSHSKPPAARQHPRRKNQSPRTRRM